MAGDWLVSHRPSPSPIIPANNMAMTSDNLERCILITMKPQGLYGLAARCSTLDRGASIHEELRSARTRGALLRVPVERERRGRAPPFLTSHERFGMQLRITEQT